jgi:hypothetical protein
MMERLEFDLLFRWFVGLGIDDPVLRSTVYGKNRTGYSRTMSLSACSTRCSTVPRPS